ncbi:DUF3949 domain-containing protein [Heyndrickxia camelliae]|uniref:DUF3949 domain-containing protein n=1 Tax=Heyndrickxia camelliae TaxID=1707093 RepID=UPI000D0A9365|nr:DUF3949 domain-containing protein [Heyndrickxia camelliae]
MDLAVIAFISALVLFFLAMIPLQYHYIKEMHEKRIRTQQSNEEIVDGMSLKSSS